jgi:Flp pilus assembly pilin Flp
MFNQKQLQNERSRKMKKFWTFLKREEGTEVAEWAVVLALVIVAAIAGVTLLGTNVGTAWNTVAGKLNP